MIEPVNRVMNDAPDAVEPEAAPVFGEGADAREPATELEALIAESLPPEAHQAALEAIIQVAGFFILNMINDMNRTFSEVSQTLQEE